MATKPNEGLKPLNEVLIPLAALLIPATLLAIGLLFTPETPRAIAYGAVALIAIADTVVFNKIINFPKQAMKKLKKGRT